MATVENFKVKVTTEGIDQLERLGNIADKARGRLDLLAASILGIGFGSFIQGALDMADRIVDLSDATGIAVGSLKGFADALESAGGKSRNAERIILGFFQAIESANDGSLKARDAFQAVGVSLDDLRNKSEADILSKTLEGLAQMTAGSERAQVATTLLTRAFRGVDVEKFIADLKAGKTTAFEAANALIAGADAADKMAEKFRILQEGALKALEPILRLLGETTLTSDAAAKAFTVLGIAMGAAFSAQLIANILLINKAILGTAAAGALLGKNPVLRALAGIALLAVEGTAAYGAYDLATNALAESQKRLAEEAAKAQGAMAGGGLVEGTGAGGDAKRKQELDARQKALVESQKRISQSLAEVDRSTRLANASDIQKIEINAATDIAKAREEIFTRENLSKAQMEEEFSAKSKEINAKRDLDIAKHRKDIELRVMKELMDQAEQDAKDMAAYYQEVDKARLQAFEQTDAIRKANEELKARIGLQGKIVEMGTIEADRAQKIFDAQLEQKRQLEAIAKIPNLPYDERLKKEEELNQKFRERIDLINQEADTRMAREQDFSAGFRETMRKYEESITPLKQGAQMAEAVYSNMGSALDRFVETGKFKFSDFTRSILIDLLKIQMRAAATSLFNSVLGSLGLGLPGRAEGGAVRPGQPYIVGEKGPEVFLPAGAGTVIPNGQSLGGGAIGGSTVVNYNINAVDSMSFKQMLARDPSFLYSVTEQGRKTIPSTRR
jgi:lambda family phage tail tape measure protein